MPEPRRTTAASRLNDEQRDLLKQVKAAQTKVTRAASTHRGAVDARDDLIRQALSKDIGVTLLARTLGVNGALIWKIRKGLTTQEADRRRESGGDT